jgi:hypothetical protein
MLFRNIKFIFLSSLFVGGLFFLANLVYSENESGDINIQYSVPSSGGGGGSTNNPPTISDVLVEQSIHTAHATWSANDDNGVASSEFVYGTNQNYILSGTVSGNFQTNLIDLLPSTVYYYKITVYDNAGLWTIYEGLFTTLPNDQVASLKIIAKPEKRIYKSAGNLALNANLIIYDPILHQVLQTLPVSLTNSGSSTYSNITVATGSGLEVFLKGQSHLSRKMTGVDISAGQNVILDFTFGNSSELLAGDVQGGGLKDNTVDILDVVSADNVFYSTNLDADLNRDGIVDVLDLSIILVNYGRMGDTMPS